MTRSSDSSETRRFSGRILALLAGVFAILIGGLELSPATPLTASAVAPKVVPDFAGGVELQGTGAALEGLLPARLLDTRGLGTVDGGGPLGALGQGSTIEIVVGGRGGVPDLGAGAVALNVTATDPTVPTFLTVWPTGEARPTASNLNVVAGMTAPNLVVVKLGKGGRVSVFNNGGSVDVVVDVAGWFPESAGLNPLVPARLADTRGLGTVDGAGPLGAVPQGGLAAVTVVGRAGVPLSGVDAVVLNVTAVSPTASTFLTVWPTGEPRPLASNLNIGPGEVRPNLVVAKVGIDGTVSVFNSAGFTDVVVDVAGWIATGAPLTTINPVRLADTRGLGTFDATGPVGKLGTAGVITLQISGRAGMPAAGVAVLNVTATESTLPTFLTVWPTGSPRPTVSNLNLPAGDTRPNLVFAPIGANGTVSIFNNAGTVHVIVDLAGIFTIPTGGTNKITAASGTRFAGPGDVISTNLDASGAGTVTLAGSADVPPVGGFLIATNDGIGPAGIVVKIVAVALQSDGTTILTVTPAVLQEAVRLDDVHQSGPLQMPDEPDSLPPLVAESAQSVQSAGSTTSGAIKADFWTPNKFKNLTCSGGVNGTTEDLGFKVQLQNVNHEFEMVAAAQTGGYFMEGDVVLQTRIAVHTNISCAISVDLAKIPFTIPGVPVPFELNFKIGIDLTIEGGSSWTETSTYHFRVGSLYTSGSWHTSNTVYRVAKTATNVVPEGAITLKPYIEVNLYIGSSTAVAAGLRFTVAFPFRFGVEWSIPDNQNCATLTLKIELELELALTALGGTFDATLSLAKWTVWPTVPPKELYKHCFAGPPPTTTTAPATTTTISPGSTTTTVPPSQTVPSLWSTTVTPFGPYGSDLVDVSCTSASFCMAVGNGLSYGLTTQWTGTAWSSALSLAPDPESASNYNNKLAGVSCITASNCTLVGSKPVYNGTFTTPYHGLVQVWDGSKWNAVARPPEELDWSELADVSCTSADFCMAVGRYGSQATHTLVEHWNGIQWSVVSSPNPDATVNNELVSVSCTSTTFCVAVGASVPSVQPNNFFPRSTLVEMWDGANWTVVASPNHFFAGSNQLVPLSSLQGVSCTSPNACLAVGDLTIAWDGVQWTDSTDPTYSGANSVSCTATFCAAGTYGGNYATSSLEILVGQTWTAHPVTAPAKTVSSVFCLSSSCVAVGSSDASSAIAGWLR